MQKQILSLYAFATISLVAMEKESRFPLRLMHDSPAITRIHSPEYLRYLQKKPLTYLMSDLTYVTAVLNATDDVIQTKKESTSQPHYGLSVIPDHYYGAGNALPRVFGDTYAVIPIAVAHALQSNLFKRILIIDEIFNRTKDVDDEEDDDFDDIEHYYSKGNGSLFYPNKDKNIELFNLFNGKIITSDKIEQNINSFLTTDGKDIDLIFYVLDIDEDTSAPNSYTPILNKDIPTIFILAGFPSKPEPMIHSIANDILNQLQLPLYEFDVHYCSHTETQTVQNLKIETVS